MTPDQATTITSILVAAFRPNPWTPDNTTAFAAGIADLEHEPARAAAIALTQTNVFMPRIAELRQAVLARHAATAGEAWADVQRAIAAVGSYGNPQFDPATTTALTAMGGWKAICASEDQMADRAHFLRIYDQIATRTGQEALIAPNVKRLLDNLLPNIDAIDEPRPLLAIAPAALEESA